MALRGEKVQIDLSDDDTGTAAPPVVANPFGFVNDVVERAPSAATAPEPPVQRNARSGFPSHTKRNPPSRFRSHRAASAENSIHDAVSISGGEITGFARGKETEEEDQDPMVAERKRIDEENRRTLSNMSAEDIESERQELMDSLDSSLIQRLLRRANIDQPEEPTDFPGLEDAKPQSVPKPEKLHKKVTFADNPDALDIDNHKKHVGVSQPSVDPNLDKDGPLPAQSDLESRILSGNKPPEANIHFPRPPQPPELDPSSPSFLIDLHEKYFPSLPAEPEKLEWMRSSTAQTSYSSSQSGLDPKDIRFDFVGSLLPPNLSAQIPVTAGLHHHGDAPDAAGYTISELALLARSTVPAQRCISFRTLGRILYRLGKGEFGDPGDGGQGLVGAEDTLGELARGLWSEVEKLGVIELAMAESEGQGIAGGRHLSAKSYATEAVWLWQMGGGRRMKAA